MKCKKNFKDINKYREYRERSKTRYRSKTGSGAYPPRLWTQEELKMVLDHSIPDRKLSEKICRSVAAIQQARHKIKSGIYNINGRKMND